MKVWITIGFSRYHSIPPSLHLLTQTRKCERMRERRQWRGRLIVLSLPCSARSHAQNLSGYRLSRRAAQWKSVLVVERRASTHAQGTDKTSFISGVLIIQFSGSDWASWRWRVSSDNNELCFLTIIFIGFQCLIDEIICKGFEESGTKG